MNSDNTKEAKARESLTALLLTAMEWGRDYWASFSARGDSQREVAEQFADKWLATLQQAKGEQPSVEGSALVSITVGGSTHTRTADEWLALARADLAASRLAGQGEQPDKGAAWREWQAHPIFPSAGPLTHFDAGYMRGVVASKGARVRDAKRELRKACGLSQDFDDWPLDRLMLKAVDRLYEARLALGVSLNNTATWKARAEAGATGGEQSCKHCASPLYAGIKCPGCGRVAPGGEQTAPAADEWAEAQRICDLPAVDEAIRNLLDDNTGDNATCLVREVLRASAPAPAGDAPPGFVSAELKPCPFCGSADVGNVSAGVARPSNHWHAGDSIFAVNCRNCGASVPNRYRNELVVAAWNRRATVEGEPAQAAPRRSILEVPTRGEQ